MPRERVPSIAQQDRVRRALQRAMAGQTFRQFADQLSTRRRPISYAGVYQWKKTGNLPSEWVREIARLSGYKESALHEDFR